MMSFQQLSNFKMKKNDSVEADNVESSSSEWDSTSEDDNPDLPGFKVPEEKPRKPYYGMMNETEEMGPWWSEDGGRKNCAGHIVELGTRGAGLSMLYCGMRFAPRWGCPCGRCDGICGPDDGCQCGPCKLLQQQALRNYLGTPAEPDETKN